MGDVVAEGELCGLTGYSFRRIGMTIAVHLGLTAVQRLAWGNWKNASQVAQANEAAVTLRYAGDKGKLARGVKEKIPHVVHRALAADDRKWAWVPATLWAICAEETRDEPDSPDAVLWENSGLEREREFHT